MANSTEIIQDIAERTPEPTRQVGPVEQKVQDISENLGVQSNTFLGLEISSWISLVFFLLALFIGYLLAGLITKQGLSIALRKFPKKIDHELLKRIFSDLRWLFVAWIATIAYGRLGFVRDDLRTLLGDLFYILELIFAYRIVSYSISLVEKWFRHGSIEDDREDELSPVISLLASSLRVFSFLVFLSILLSHFGINIAIFAAFLGIGGLAISLAARDTIADAISGFILLIDQPFRIGDRIEIQEVGTWGDVVNIGLRTTSIRTRDNRMVIVPNSILSSNQVVNYTFPDPYYRIQTHVGIAYGTDIEKLRTLIKETILKLDFVLTEKPVDVLYTDMGDSAMIFRVRWWIESYVDHRQSTDNVHTVLQAVFEKNGIESPFPTQTINMLLESKTVEKLAEESKGLKSSTNDAQSEKKA